MAKPVTEPFPETECSICLEELNKVNIATLKCGHTFHLDCLSNIIKLECPKCRDVIESKKVDPISSSGFNHIANDLIELKQSLPERFQHLKKSAAGYLLPDGSTICLWLICDNFDKFNYKSDWLYISDQYIFLMFQEFKGDEVLKSMDIPRNYNPEFYNNRTCYNLKEFKTYIESKLVYCLMRFMHLRDITELLECIMLYNNKNLSQYYKIQYPDISELIKKPIQDSTMKKLLMTPDIQEQLKNNNNPEISELLHKFDIPRRGSPIEELDHRVLHLEANNAIFERKCVQCECKFRTKDFGNDICDNCKQNDIRIEPNISLNKKRCNIL